MTGFLHGARGKFKFLKNKFLKMRKKLKNFVDFFQIFSIVFLVQSTSHQFTSMLKSQTVSFVNLSDITSLSEEVENIINDMLENAPWSFGDTSYNLVNIKTDFIPELDKIVESSDYSKEEQESILDTILSNFPSDVKYVNLVG